MPLYNHSMFNRFTVAGGIHIAADLSGDPQAPPVVLMHGGGQTRHSWHGASAELVKCGYHVLNLDARGHGDSDWSPQGDYSLEALAADLETVTKTLSQPPALVGASMGAATALYAAGNFGAEFARALVLVDFVPDMEAVGAQKILAFMNANLGGFGSVAEAADAVSAYNPHRARPSDYSGLKKNLRLRADGRWYWHWDPRFVNNAERGEPPQFGARLSDAAQRVRIPTLLVRGLLSDIVSDRGIAKLRAKLPALELFDVAGAAHMVAGDENDSFNQGVVAFLRRQMPASVPFR